MRKSIIKAPAYICNSNSMNYDGILVPSVAKFGLSMDPFIIWLKYKLLYRQLLQISVAFTAKNIPSDIFWLIWKWGSKWIFAKYG